MALGHDFFDKLLNAPELLRPGSKPFGQVRLRNPQEFVGYWLLNNSERDLGPNGYHGTLNTGAARAIGAYGYETTFDRSSHIDVGYIDMAGRDAITVTALVKTTGAGTDEHTIFSNFSLPNNISMCMLRLEPGATNSPEGFVISSAGQVGGGFTDLTIPDNEYAIVTLRYNSVDGSGLCAFRDGVKSSTTYASSDPFDPDATSNNTYIGGAQYKVADGLEGSVVMCSAQTRGLSDAEVYALHWDLYRDLEPIHSVAIPETAAAAGLSIPIAAYHYNHNLR